MKRPRCNRVLSKLGFISPFTFGGIFFSLKDLNEVLGITRREKGAGFNITERKGKEEELEISTAIKSKRLRNKLELLSHLRKRR